MRVAPEPEGDSAALVRLHAIIQTAVDGIITIDSTGKIETFNPAAEKMFGYKEGEVLGTNVSCLMPEPYRGEHDRYLERYLKTREAKIIGNGREVTALRKDGSEFPMDLAVTSMEIAGETKFTAIVRDISRRKELEALALLASRTTALGEVVRGIAHELCQPLNIIRMATDTLYENIESEGRADDFTRSKLKRIDAQIDRSMTLIEHMRSYSQDHNRNFGRFDVREAVEAALLFIGEQFRSRGIELDVDMPDGPVIAIGSPSNLEAVLLHLLVNARDAIMGEFETRPPERRGGRVIVRVGVTGGKTEISVEDDGGGLPDIDTNRLYDPLFSTKSAKQGVGMGLSVAHGGVKGMGGQLIAENVSAGAKFSIILPPVDSE